MKGAVIAAVILVILLLLVGLNAFHLKDTADTFTHMMTSLPEHPLSSTADEVREIQDYVKKKEPIILLTVNHTELDRISELLLSLELYAEGNAVLDYRVTRVLLLDAVEDIARSERLHLF